MASRVLDATVGYGYRPWLAAIWLALLLAVGTTVYAINQPHALTGGPVPRRQPSLTSANAHSAAISIQYGRYHRPPCYAPSIPPICPAAENPSIGLTMQIG